MAFLSKMKICTQVFVLCGFEPHRQERKRRKKIIQIVIDPDVPTRLTIK